MTKAALTRISFLPGNHDFMTICTLSRNNNYIRCNIGANIWYNCTQSNHSCSENHTFSRFLCEHSSFSTKYSTVKALDCRRLQGFLSTHSNNLSILWRVNCMPLK